MMCNLCFPSVKNVGRILVAVRRATARLVIKHTHANDTLKYDLKRFVFVKCGARQRVLASSSGATCNRARICE